jgi:hypothetical protein
MGMQAIDLCSQRKKIVKAGVNVRALRRSEERTGTLWRMCFLRERVNVLVDTVRSFGIPTRPAKLQAQIQDAVLEIAGRRAVVVRHDDRQRRWFGC